MKESKKRALITGISGQVGSYLAEFLLSKDYEVHGIIRLESLTRLSCAFSKLILHYGDLSDSESLCKLMRKIKPHEVYNLAAQSDVKVSFDVPTMTCDVNGLGVLRLLEIIKQLNEDTESSSDSITTQTKFYQASTSELFGGSFNSIPQDEKTPFYPKSPYACAKLLAHTLVINFRESYNLYAVNGILFNHESPRRGENFVTKKITRSVAEIYLNKRKCFELGNLNSRRDWGHARDYVVAMWLMLQQDKPKDYVISSDESHSVREFVEEAFKCINTVIVWKGTGLSEIGVDSSSGEVLVKLSEDLFRPSEVDHLLGCSKLARRELGWIPKVKFRDLVREMVDYDIKLLSKSDISEKETIKYM